MDTWKIVTIVVVLGAFVGAGAYFYHLGGDSREKDVRKEMQAKYDSLLIAKKQSDTTHIVSILPTKPIEGHINKPITPSQSFQRVLEAKSDSLSKALAEIKVLRARLEPDTITISDSLQAITKDSVMYYVPFSLIITHQPYTRDWFYEISEGGVIEDRTTIRERSVVNNPPIEVDRGIKPITTVEYGLGGIGLGAVIAKNKYADNIVAGSVIGIGVIELIKAIF